MTEQRIYYSHDAEVQAQHEMRKTMIFLLAGALAIGAAVVLLFAPSSGKKTRSELGHAMEDGLNNGREAVAPVVKQVQTELADLRKNVEEHSAK